MKKRLLIFLIILQAGILHAYNFQTIYSNRTYLYQTTSSKEIMGFKIDSVKYINSDSILFPLKNIQQIGEHCVTPFGDSWLGAKIIINKDWNYFFNTNLDTIRIKTSAKQGEKWVVFQKGDTVVTGEITNVKPASFLSVNDTVKYINLTFTGLSKFPELEGTLMLSKHYGLINTFNFYSYLTKDPGYTLYTPYYMYPQLLTLVGISNPTLGIQNFGWFDVFDFEPGDELQIKEESTCLGQYCSNNNYSNTIRIKYTDRINYPDSIVYHYEQTTVTSSGTTTTTRKEVIHRNDEFGSLPNQPIVNTNYSYCWQMGINSNGIPAKRRNDEPLEFMTPGTSGGCGGIVNSDGCLPVHYYLKGLGGPYSYCDGWGQTYEYSLKYYKKGNYEWGTKLISNLKNITNPPVFRVFPVCTKDVIHIHKQNNDSKVSKATIVNCTGKIILEQIISNQTTTISLQSLPTGIYLLKLDADSYKVIKE